MFVVFAVEIRRILITNESRGAAGVKIFAEHQAACFLQQQVFPELNGAYRGYGLEVMLEARNAHPEVTGDCFDSKLLR